MQRMKSLGKKLAVVLALVAIIATAVPGVFLNSAQAASPATGANILATARQYLGRPYVFGASGPRSFDCSGFVRYVYRQYGIYLPHSAATQSRYGDIVAKSNLKVGDLVFFSNTYKRGISHVGIYAGNNQIIHAFPGDGVTITSLSDRYLTSKYAFSTRLLR